MHQGVDTKVQVLLLSNVQLYQKFTLAPEPLQKDISNPIDCLLSKQYYVIIQLQGRSHKTKAFL